MTKEGWRPLPLILLERCAACAGWQFAILVEERTSGLDDFECKHCGQMEAYPVCAPLVMMN